VNYNDLVNDLRTGDLFLFHGSSGISRKIEDVTRGEFSHAAMVVRPHVDQPPLIWQTGPNPLKEDVVTTSMHGGAQLSDLLTTVTMESSPQYGDVPHVRRLTATRTDAFETMAPPPNSYSPSHFGGSVALLGGASLGEIVQVTMPAAARAAGA
jgi:hypothetical protein